MKQILFIIYFSIFSFSVVGDEIDDLTKLANDGDPIAQNNLGHYYLNVFLIKMTEYNNI